MIANIGEYAGHVKLECISRLYPDNTFLACGSNYLTENLDYGSVAIMCN
jgi:hypothetical protein